MKLQVLVSTMNRDKNGGDLYREMNIQTDAIICNQTNFYEVAQPHSKLIVISQKEVGLSKSRNVLISHAKSEICLIADDDVVYDDNLEETILNAFEKYKDADLIIFNLKNLGERFIISEDFKVGEINYQRFGSVRIAFKRDSIMMINVKFNELFGAGSKYESGEDTLFLKACLDKNLKIFAVSDYIGKLEENRESTWFRGKGEKFYHDKGALFKALYPKTWLLWCAQFVIRKKPTHDNLTKLKAYKQMIRGANSFHGV